MITHILVGGCYRILSSIDMQALMFIRHSVAAICMDWIVGLYKSEYFAAILCQRIQKLSLSVAERGDEINKMSLETSYKIHVVHIMKRFQTGPLMFTVLPSRFIILPL